MVGQVFGGIEPDVNDIGGPALSQFFVHNGCNGHVLGKGVSPGRGHKHTVVFLLPACAADLLKIIREGDLPVEASLKGIVVEHALFILRDGLERFPVSFQVEVTVILGVKFIDPARQGIHVVGAGDPVCPHGIEPVGTIGRMSGHHHSCLGIHGNPDGPRIKTAVHPHFVGQGPAVKGPG